MVCSIGNANMAAFARLQAIGSASQTLRAEEVCHQKLATKCSGRDFRDVDEENLLDEEDMDIYGLRPITDPLDLPGPRDSLFHCFIKRNRSTQTCNLFMNLSQALADDGKFIMAARKCRRPTCTDYVISLHSDDMSKGNDTYVGKLRSNFLGTKFIVYDALPPHSGTKVAKSWSSIVIGPAGNYPVGHLSYELNVLGARSKTPGLFSEITMKVVTQQTNKMC